MKKKYLKNQHISKSLCCRTFEANFEVVFMIYYFFVTNMIGTTTHASRIKAKSVYNKFYATKGWCKT